MKRISYLVTLVFLMGLTMFSCKDDTQDETPEQKSTKILTAGPYTVATVDGEALAGTVTINFKSDNKAFSVSGGELPAPFPSSGSWAFSGTDFKNITLTSGGTTLPLTVNTLSDNALIFTYPGSGVKATDPTVTVTVSAKR